MAGMTVEPILKKKIVEYFYCSNHYTALFFILKYVLMVLHVQIKLPSVLAQAAFLSQGVDAHSSISIKCQKIDVISAKKSLKE
jgi:hypothetical protein